MRLLILCCLAIILLAAGCSGNDKITVDTIPPIPPILVPHLGDLGDAQVSYNGQMITLNDENNGIDAVPDGDWIKVSWEHFLDTDLDYVKIFRYDEINADPVLVDSISAANEYYVDSRSQLSTHVRYSYFIEVVDNNGNSAVSDTVSYALLSKQLLVSPANNEYIDSNNITFVWQRSGFISKVRVLVFDENQQYLWHRDIDVANEEDEMTTSMPSNWQQSLEYTGNHIYWRVDAFEWDNELQFFIGSESYLRILYLNSER
jgi:hypothetical protein